MAFSSREKPLFENKKFLDDTLFIQFLLSHASDNTTSRNIGGIGRPPPQILEGTVPQSPKVYAHVELCADVIVSARARRSISVGGGGAPPVQKNRRRRRRGAAWAAKNSFF